MDLVSLLPFIGLAVDGLMMVLIGRHYLKTRFRPSLILLLLYSIFIMIHLFWIPIAFAGPGDSAIAENAMIGVIYLVSLIPVLTIAFYESTRNQPYLLLLLAFFAFYAFLLGFGFSINWVFTYDRIWLYQLIGFNLIIFAAPFAAVVSYSFIRLFQIIFEFPKKISLKLHWKFGKRSKPLFILWTGGLLLRYLSILLISTQGASELNIAFLIGSILIVSFTFLYDPSSFFLSNSQIKALFIFDAESGLLLNSIGGDQDGLRASGLFGTGILQREITGASSLPHRLIFLDRVVLLEYQKVHNKVYGMAIIIDSYNPAFLPSLKFALQRFVKSFQNELKDWNCKQDIFCNFTPKLIEIFNYALSQDVLDSNTEGVRDS